MQALRNLTGLQAIYFLIKTIVVAFCLVISLPAKSQSFFIAYEFGEMILNDFQNFAGEAGFTLENEHLLRLVYMDVELTEQHLSSSEAGAVDGDNVEGLWRGFEISYDLPLSKNVTVGPSIGYYDSRYQHIITNESVRKKSPTVGVSLSYSENNLFGFSPLYWRFSLTYRYYTNAIKRTTLSDTVVTGGSHEFVPWIFLGFQFY